MEVDSISKKRGYKYNLIRSDSFSKGKIVFTLLIEVRTLYVGLIIINIKRLNLEKLFFNSFFWYLSQENYLDNLL